MSIFKIKYLFSSSFYVKDNRENTYSHLKLLSSNNVNLNVKWRYDGITSAGGNGNGKGNRLNKLSDPENICVDDDQTIYIVDFENHRIFFSIIRSKMIEQIFIQHVYLGFVAPV